MKRISGVDRMLMAPAMCFLTYLHATALHEDHVAASLCVVGRQILWGLQM